VRHVELIAHHATNISEDLISLAVGLVVRHHPEAIDRS
jgi:hypothetical protein